MFYVMQPGMGDPPANDMDPPANDDDGDGDRDVSGDMDSDADGDTDESSAQKAIGTVTVTCLESEEFHATFSTCVCVLCLTKALFTSDNEEIVKKPRIVEEICFC